MLRYVLHPDFWNPFRRRGGYAAPHITLLGLIVLLALAATGAFAVKRGVDWASRIQQARTTLDAHGGTTISRERVFIAPPTGGPHLPPTGGILFRYFPPTEDQGKLEPCAALGFERLLSYEYDRAHHAALQFSARQLYDIDTGGDPGALGFGVTTSISDYNEIAATQGVVSSSELSYGPHQSPRTIQPWAIEPVPASDAHGMRIASHQTPLWTHPGAGPGAVLYAKQAIAADRPVAISSDWYRDSERASWITGKMGVPGIGDQVEYTHTVILVRYNDSIRNPDGTTGAFLASNPFGLLYGRDRYGNINRGHGGYVWLSYRYVAQYAGYGVVEDLGLPRSGGGHALPPAVDPLGPTYRAPLDVGPQTGGAYSPYVHNVVLHDTGYDITGLINYWVWYYRSHGVPNMSGVGLVATALTESSLNQVADRCCIPGDTSYGTFQFTTGTAQSFGIYGDIRAQLDNPVISVRIAAEYYANTLRSHPAVPFPYQYVFYNAGGGVSDAFAFNPTNVAYSNFQNFLSNWNYALRYYMGGGPPAPPVVQVFHLNRWCRVYTARKWPGCPSPYWRGHLGVAGRFWAFAAGVDHRLGGVIHPEIWSPRLGLMTTVFQHGKIFTHPRRRGDRPYLLIVPHCLRDLRTCA